MCDTAVTDDAVLCGLDVVYIATIHQFHVSLSLMMLNAGKHVLCEKPMSLTLTGAKRVLDLAQKKHLFFVEVAGGDNNNSNKWSK